MSCSQEVRDRLRFNWYGRERMRVWLVHPEELDDQRLLAQHQEVHMAIGIIRSCETRGYKIGGVCKPWSDPKGLAALDYLHDLCVSEMRNRGFNGHATPLLLNGLAGRVAAAWESGALDFSQNEDNWPPPWVEEKDIKADVMDLQIRWEREGKTVWLKRSIQKYGKMEGGQLSGSITRL